MAWKVVINTCYGGYGLSAEAVDLLRELKGEPLECYRDWQGITRHDKDLVKVVETLGDKASNTYAKLKVVEIDFPAYMIDEYDGIESIRTPDADTYIYIDDTLTLEGKQYV